jgi:hypothetical protein
MDPVIGEFTKNSQLQTLNLFGISFHVNFLILNNDNQIPSLDKRQKDDIRRSSTGESIFPRVAG